MARVTVIKGDNAVYVDTEALPIDCTDLPEYFHAIQWYGEADPPYGEIEFALDSQGRKLPNVKFTDITPFTFLVDNHRIEKERRVKEAATRAEAANAAANPPGS